MKRIIFLFILLVSLAAGSNAQVLYKVEGNGLGKPSYIFGTHHLASLSFLDSLPGVKDCFDATDQVVGEVVMTENPMTLAMKMQQYMLAPADSTLSTLYDAATYTELNEKFKKYSPYPGMDLSAFEPMRPMVITALVSVSLVKDALPDYKEGEQLDTYFQTLGKENNKKIIALETPEQQALLLYCSTPITKQAEELKELLDDPEAMSKSAAILNQSYYAQDLAKLLEMSKKEDANPEFMVKLLDDRNADWLTKLPGIMNEAPSFIAVGALHLTGDNGILEGLWKAGFTVTPVTAE